MIKSEPSIPEEIPRRRGRPAGKNRIPLTLQERRARNAQYERERRTETADAMQDLAEAAGCDPRISNAELLATVITHLQRNSERKSSDDISELRRINDDLMVQITTLEERLKNEKPYNNEKMETPNDLEYQPKVRESYIGQNSCNTITPVEDQCNENKSVYKVKIERLSGKRCLPESSDSDSQPEKIPKLMITKTENNYSNVFKPQTTSVIKQETAFDDCKGSSRRDSNSITHIETVANGIANQMDESKLEYIPVQFGFNIAEQSSQNQVFPAYENEANQPYIEQSSSDYFTSVENEVLSTWLECDDIFEADNQSDNVYEMKWLNDDLFHKFTP